MDIAKDIVDKYSPEQIIAFLDKTLSGVLQNYKTSLKQENANVLWGNLGDIAQMKAIIHEMNKRNQEREAQKQM